MKKKELDNILKNFNFDRREHHYCFAYRALPDLLWDDSRETFLHLYGDNEDAIEFLKAIWNWVADEFSIYEKIDNPKFKYQHFKYKNYAICIVVLPEPIAHNEAFMVALIFGPIIELNDKTLNELKTRYFSLENGFPNAIDEPRTTLAEWEPGYLRIRYGDGPEPKIESFAECICEILDKD